MRHPRIVPTLEFDRSIVSGNEELQQSIARQRHILKNWLSSSLAHLAEACLAAWPDRQALEQRLMEGLNELPYCKYLYVLDSHARQLTANASRGGLLPEHFGRDRSDRPYRKGMPPARALAILAENRGPQWDPDLVARFVRLMEPATAAVA